MPMETAAMAYTLAVTRAGMGVISCMKGISTRENSPTLVRAVEAMMPMRPGIFRKCAATRQAIEFDGENEGGENDYVADVFPTGR